jgi:phosphoribosylformimino-5-aminoimidazole carboxamide ribotide isomerase
MELIAAIDILDGNVVRLHQGHYDQVTVYARDPVEQAKQFYEQGARRLHVVDLDGAKQGKPVNAATIERIVREVPLEVQVGGGIRTQQTALQWFETGVKRVVLGTATVREPEWVQALASSRGSQMVVAVDAKDGRVAVEGWVTTTDVLATDLARAVDTWGVGGILYTDIARDGTRHGPNVQATAALQRLVGAEVIASGGIGSLDDVRALALAGVRAAVCGRALYSGAFTYAEGRDVAIGAAQKAG